MDLSLLEELIYIKSIPINSENESLIREKIQYLFLKAVNGQKNCENISEIYYKKAVITGCRSIIKEIKNFKILTGENCGKAPADIFALLRPAAAACTFLLSPSISVNADIPDDTQLKLMCSVDVILWCVLCLIGAAASLTENGKIKLSVWETKNGAAVKVTGSLIFSLCDLEEELLQHKATAQLCQKAAELHSGQFFSVYERYNFSMGFTIISPKLDCSTDEKQPPFSTVYDLISDRLSPLYAALNDTAPCLL